MKKLYAITVKGHKYLWSFDTFLDPKHLNDYIDDGLDIMEVINTAPDWIVDCGLMRPWFFLQDLWNFKWLFWIINKTKGKIL